MGGAADILQASQLQAENLALRQQVADGEENLQLALHGNDRSNETIDVCHTFVEDCDRATKRAHKEARDWERYCFTVFDDTSAQILSQEDAEALGLEDASSELKGETAILKNMADNLSTQRTDNIKFEIHVGCTEPATPPSKRAIKKSADEYIVNLTCYESSTDAFCTKPVTTSPVDLYTVCTISSLKSTCNIDASLKLGGIANRENSVCCQGGAIRLPWRVQEYLDYLPGLDQEQQSRSGLHSKLLGLGIRQGGRRKGYSC